MDFLLRESNIVLDVSDDDPSKLLEVTNEEAIEQPREPKKKPEDIATPKGGVFGLVSDNISQADLDSDLLMTKHGTSVGSPSNHLTTPSI